MRVALGVKKIIKMNLRERGGGGGGGDHFDVNTASANEIESEMNQRLEKGGKKLWKARARRGSGGGGLRVGKWNA